MKRIASLILFLVAIHTSSALYAQSEIQVGYGIFFSQEVESIFSNRNKSDLVTLPGNLSKYVDGHGPWSVGYGYTVNKNFTIGLLFAASSLDVEYAAKDASERDYDSQKVITKSYSFLLRTSYVWFRTENLKVYSGVALGAVYQESKLSRANLYDDKFKFAYQADLFGVRAGGKLGAYLELGYGYAGVANVGLSLIF